MFEGRKFYSVDGYFILKFLRDNKEVNEVLLRIYLLEKIIIDSKKKKIEEKRNEKNGKLCYLQYF